jgi:primosomal protein N' (replication factor Y)
MTILRVAIAVPLYRTFDYRAPADIGPERLRPGVRLRVPFGRNTRCALLLETPDASPVEDSRLKTALDLIDSRPLLQRSDLELLLWAADYYQHPSGEVLFSALPTGLRKGKPVSEPGNKGWRLTDPGTAIPMDGLPRAPRQAAVLRELRTAPQGLSRSELYARCDPCASILRTLEAKAWIQRCTLPLSQPPPRQTVAPALTPAQQQAVECMEQNQGGFHVFLLDGVTGSGKTEVYLALVEQHLAAGHQILLLAPEIALTPQLLRRFRRRIQAPVALLHSGLSDGEREQAWLDASSGRARVLLGTRSSVFTPLPDLGLILVDEEHDLSYKQQEGFRYSARDMAVARARQRGCAVVLGSATPSLESLRNADAGRYARLVLPERAGGARAPELDLLDIRSVHLVAGMSPVLLRLMDEELERGNQILLFLNRRGYAPVLTCHDCGWISGCSRCDARMTLHKEAGLLWCHHCGHQHRPPRACPDCSHEDLRLLGQGTERLEEALKERLPELAIARIDRDSTRRKGVLQDMLEAIRGGRYQVLLGTQMLAKGHHFPDVTLVGILDIDQGLFGADYRASERMAQMIVQVAGRAGRAEKPGRVVIQTRNPDHPLLQNLIRRGYPDFARQALAERRAAGLPPFSFQALLRAEATRAEAPERFLDQALSAAQPLCGPRIELWGPVPAPMEKRAGRYRAHLLIQTPHRRELQQLLACWIPQIASLPSARRVRWSIDVDPQEML